MRNLVFDHHPLRDVPIPQQWTITNIQDVTEDVQPGFPSGQHNREGKGVPHLRPMNISRQGTLDLSDVKYVEARVGFEVRTGDVIFNNTNSPELVGKTAVCMLNASLAYSNHMTRLRVNGAIDAVFLSHELHWLWMTGYFRHRCINHVNQASISSGPLIESVPVALPPLTEQRRIVAEVEKQLTRIDVAADSLFYCAGRCEKYLNSILPRLCSLPANADSDGFAPLPNRWQWVRVRDAGEVKLGRQRAPQHHTGTHMRPYLRVANVYEDRLDLKNVMQMNFTPAEFDVYELKRGDILLNEGQSLELVGRPAMYRDEIPGACFQKTLLRFRAFPAVLPEFALLVFRAYLRTGRFQRAAKWTTSMAHLSAVRFGPMFFPLPPLEVQHRIVACAEREITLLSNVRSAIAASKSRAARLRQAILTKAFSGQLIPQDPNDEPASALLERIRAERVPHSKKAVRRKRTPAQKELALQS